MEKQIRQLSEIASSFMDHAQNLQKLADQAVQVGSRIAKMGGELGLPDRVFDKPESDSQKLKFSGYNSCLNRSSNIIPFPETNYFVYKSKESSGSGNKHHKNTMPYLATPGKLLPDDIHDFRPSLQRDGLILLSWDLRMNGEGRRFTAYWVTSAGVPRFYASKPLSSEDFPSARPDHKSYAAEDGIEFYGQDTPLYMVHVAPELMKSNPRHAELRNAHVNVLKLQGTNVDFNYRYLLKNDKKRALPQGKPKNNSFYWAGTWAEGGDLPPDCAPPC